MQAFSNKLNMKNQLNYLANHNFVAILSGP